VDVDVEDLLEEADVEGEEESRSERRARIWGFSHNPSNCSFFIFFAPEMKPRHVSAPQKQSKP